MSNSAFTPSTTTVTNNVPVNVPVVTAWENYTPTISPISGYATSPHGQWRRVGDNMEVRISFKKNTSAGTGGTLLFGLPSGYNIDVTKCATEATDQPAFGIANGFNIITSNQYDRSLTVMYANGNTTQVAVINPGTTAFINGSNVLANSEFNLEFRVPISQWAGSGTTTLATRAVEEYASNTTGEGATNGSTYSNSAFFRNGPEGSKFPNIGTVDTTVGSTKYYIQWQSPQLATDNIIIEMRYPGLNTWTPVTEFPQMRMGSSQYGISYVATSATQGYVQFGRAGSLPAGASYGATGNAWNNFYSATDSLSYYWRVRKVSSGAQVGYPVSARNIVGDTSGSVVPVGMLGERIFSQASGISVAASNTIRGLGTLSFQAGTWMIFCSSSLTWSGDPNGSSLILSTTSATSNVFTQLGMTAANVNDVSMSTSSNPANTRFGSINGIVATFTSQTTVFVNIYSFNSVSSSNASYSIWAVRIA